ncbi:MAG: ABC transporter ATP-binding protein [Candidatus Dadabacteria bacterium]|nr:ABC transporter ATP-binding protein [Candidatus Dadabacteria bacterium]
MNNDIAISVRNLNKIYKMYRSPSERFKELLHPFKKKYHQEFQALKDINLDIPKGTIFGIIGQNGSGKSTLLQIITGIIRPTSGTVKVNGRVSALLELGAGFHREFTGRENVFMQGTLMRMKREEIERNFDEIVSFADIGDFIDQPVKTYSSGMYARLAFATAINVSPDILIIDEILAVGDGMFQNRCHRKIEEFRNSGKTVIFVSHNLKVVTKICNRAIFLDRGHVLEVGNPEDLVNSYNKLSEEREKQYLKHATK